MAAVSSSQECAGYCFIFAGHGFAVWVSASAEFSKHLFVEWDE
jgi:hypothetical protein